MKAYRRPQAQRAVSLGAPAVAGRADRPPGASVRLGPEAADRALAQPHVRPIGFTGRPMKGMVFADPADLRGDAPRQWVCAAVGYARGLPPKHPAPAARTRR